MTAALKISRGALHPIRGPHAARMLGDFPDEYCSGVFSDEFDQMGQRAQIAPGFEMNNPLYRCFGRARTVLLETVETDDEQIEIGLGFLETLVPGDVLVVQGSQGFAYFGELMTRLCLRQELAGVVIDGLTRDSTFTRTVELPIFTRGYSPVDIKGRGRVAAVDVPVNVGATPCRAGDIIFGDSDAVVVIPEDQLNEVMKRVQRNAELEHSLKARIDEGLSVSEILQLTKGF